MSKREASTGVPGVSADALGVFAAVFAAGVFAAGAFTAGVFMAGVFTAGVFTVDALSALTREVLVCSALSFDFLAGVMFEAKKKNYISKLHYHSTNLWQCG